MVKYNGIARRLKPCKIKIEGTWELRKGRVGNMEINAKSKSRLKVSSGGELTISIGSLFHEMGIIPITSKAHNTHGLGLVC